MFIFLNTFLIFMSKANQAVVGYTPTPIDKKSEGAVKSRALYWVGLCVFASIALIGNASAAINTTAITDAIDVFTTVTPAIADMVMSILPTIIVISVVGFILKFWDNILEMVKSFTRLG